MGKQTTTSARRKTQESPSDQISSQALAIVEQWTEQCPAAAASSSADLDTLKAYIEQGIRAAVEAERTACVQIAEAELEVWADIASDGGQEASRGIAAFIRARSGQTDNQEP